MDLTIRGQCERARYALSAGQAQGAIDICRRMLRAFPAYIEAYAILGEAALKLGQLDRAVGLFHRVLSADPEHAGAHTHLAMIYEAQGQMEEGLWHWRKSLELAPESAEAWQGVCRLSARLGGEEIVRAPMTRAALARTYQRGQLYPQAIVEFRALLAGAERSPDLLVAQAEALWLNGCQGEAEAACQGILSDLPDCLKANLILGRIWLSLSRDEEGRALLLRAQALDPENGVAQSLLGTDSPLPPRVARVPATESDYAPLDLPYLVDEQPGVEEFVVIEGQVATPEVRPVEQPPPRAEAAEQNEDDALSPEGIPRQGEAPLPLAEAPPRGKSLLDVRREYVAEHPEDARARLDLARRLGEKWRVDEAVEQYRTLMELSYEALPDVVSDLERLNRIFPNTPSLVEVLRAAHLRERRGAS